MKIAIIGGGIGGCATAYFAHNMLRDSTVTLYEKNGLGGRVLTKDVDGLRREVGATFFTSSNRILMGFVKDLGLRTRDIGALASIGIWDGKGFAFRSGSGPFFTKLKLASKHRLALIYLTSLIEKTRIGLRKLYEKAEHRHIEMRHLLNESGLNSWLNRTFREILEEGNVGSGIIEEVVEPLTRLIYNQGAEINGFAGLTTMLAVYDKHLLKLDDGNISLPVRLTESSGAVVELDHRVEGIERNTNGTLLVVGENFSDEHDTVILAAPIELLGVVLGEVANVDIKVREFQRVYTKILKGAIDPRYFGLRSSKELPRFILTTSNSSFCNLQTIGKASNGETLYSITHSEPVMEKTLNQIFSNQETIFEHLWGDAYPVFKPEAEMPPTILGNGLYYLNSMETAVSSMESSSFAALNAVRLIKAGTRT